MNKTTTNDLINYLFNETQMSDTVQIQQNIDTNYLVHEEFEELKESFVFLDSLALNPSKSVIESIKAYSVLTSGLQIH